MGVPYLIIFLLGEWLLHGGIMAQSSLPACLQQPKGLGMQSGAISDGQITASSESDSAHAVIYGRLFYTAHSGGWVASLSNTNQWLQIDLGEQKAHIGLTATQGRHGQSQWVTKYKLQYSDLGTSFLFYKQQGQSNDKIFNGNTDSNTVVYHFLFPPITTRYVRFRPLTWKAVIAMRVEPVGCRPSNEQESSSPVTQAYDGLCRSLKFTAPVKGSIFDGHVIKNISLSVGMHEVTCRDRCVMEGTCVSFNIGPPTNDTVICQLSDSEHTLHPSDLKLKAGFTYRGAENPCSSSPCFYNGTCLNGFTPKKYLCVCPAGTYGEQCEKVATSCKELYDKNMISGDKAYLLTLDSVVLPVYCHMATDLGSCRRGGWTLVMKIDGTKNTFHYDSSYWSNKTGHNLNNGATGFSDFLETKLPSYWNSSFTKICLGMRIKTSSQIAFIVMNKEARSLYSLIADGQYSATSMGRNQWKALMGVDATLQTFCDYEGFNVVCSDSASSRARIGIVNNDNDLCNTCDSRIGFGTGGYIDDTNTCGNVGPGTSDNGGKNVKTMGYIFVQ